MEPFKQFDISDVFNEINDPLFIIDSDEIIFFNTYFQNNFIPTALFWRDVITEKELVKSLENFFNTGKVPDKAFIKSIKSKSESNLRYGWSFTNLPSSYSERFLIVSGHDMRSLLEQNRREVINEELLKSEAKYRTLVEESTEIIFSLSETLELSYISPNVEQFLGYKAQEVIGTNILNYMNPEDMDVFHSLHVNAKDFLAQNQHLEFRVKHKNGGCRVVSSNGRMFQERGSKGRFYTGVARDITELKQTQKELFHAKEKAEQASLAKSQFLSVVSHEIRTPMNAIIGLAHFLLEEDPREDQLENLKSLKFSAESLMELINDILDFNKIELGKIELEKVPFDVIGLINRIVNSFSVQARVKGLKINAEIDGDIPHNLIGDSVRITQILNNLISNAVKFTEKGEVKVSVDLAWSNENTYGIKFVIEDSGIGIPEDKIDSIFEAFTQASSATTRKFGGSGLGLAIVKKLLELHRSEIHVSSTVGVGTRFEFELNFTSVEENFLAKAEPKAPYKKSLENVSVLVAEDNLINQILIKKFLMKWDVGNLVIASDGQQAIDLFDQSEFDVILLDIQMPVLDGLTVAKRIREHENTDKRNIPILLLSATSYHENKEEIQKLRINDFIEKPFTPEGLYEKLAEHLASKDLRK